MAIDESSQENIPNDSEAYYEAVASQEEIYLEEVEEELRSILTFGDPTPLQKEVERSMCDANNNLRSAESLDEQLDHAAEELITGDSDDPPLSAEAALEMIRVTHMSKLSGSMS